MKNKWLKKRKEGLYCIPGDFYIDPLMPVKKAVITHSHTDHARPNNKNILATEETVEIMKIRYGKNYCESEQRLNYNEKININGVEIKLIPAGHIIGSAQIYLKYKGEVTIVSGDYKRTLDITCLPFEVSKCHTFITEATFGLPVFTHPCDRNEANKIIKSIENNNEIHLIGVYALGKCQRLISLLREQGFEDTIYLHGALMKISDYYLSKNIYLGKIKNVSELKNTDKNKIILCPPSALHNKWSQKFKGCIKGFVSGWMLIRQRIKQKNINLPVVISDHGDWGEIIKTIKEIRPENVLVTHGREEALITYLNNNGINCGALNLLGYEEEDD